MGLFDLFKKRREDAAGPDPEVEVLVSRLTAPDWRTRFDAATALGRMKLRAAAAQPALEEATSDENDEVCTAAADALSSIRRALDGR